MCFTAFSCVLICWSDAFCLFLVLAPFDFLLAAGIRVFFAAEAFFLPALLLPTTQQPKYERGKIFTCIYVSDETCAKQETENATAVLNAKSAENEPRGIL